jgi:short-subunit dehydrogenase
LQIDVLVNNAGLGGVGRFDQMDPQRISDMLMINVVALTELTRLLMPGMVVRRRGKVLLVASTASFQPGPRMAVYFATKAYVLSLGEALAYELRGTSAAIRLFGDSGAGAKGMPYYTVIYGAEGRRKVIAKRRLPRLPHKLAF